MLNPVNPIVNRVTEAKRRAARAIVLSSLSALDCVVFKKVIDQPNDHDQRLEMYGDVEILGSSDEHAFSYEEKGFARILLENFTGGAIVKDWSSLDGFELSFYGQIEPIFPNLERRQQLIQVPTWNIENNDRLAVIFSPDVIKYLDVIAPEGQSLVEDFCPKYRLNKSDDFDFIKKFSEYSYEIKEP